MHFSTTTYTTLLLSALTLFSASTFTPVAEAHSWMDCVDWRFKGSKQDFSDKGGRCEGYARRFPTGKAFGSLDSANPSRHYQQAGNPSTALPCSDRKQGKDKGSDETLANPISKAYGGSWGKMTVAKVGQTLCVRWPAKNHAEKNEDNTVVQINFMKIQNNKDPTQQALLKNTIKKLPYKNCGTADSNDKRPCGGCFQIPAKSSAGMYLLQWRWMLNPGEWYTSCADIQVTGGSGGAKASGVTETVNSLVGNVRRIDRRRRSV